MSKDDCERCGKFVAELYWNEVFDGAVCEECDNLLNAEHEITVVVTFKGDKQQADDIRSAMEDAAQSRNAELDSSKVETV